MTTQMMPLIEVDEVQITTVMDNVIDMLMASTEVAERYPLRSDIFQFEEARPMAEHGFSALVHARLGQQEAQVLFDTGVSARGLLHNLDAFEIRPADLQAIVLSHGHADHSLGLAGLVSRLGTHRLPLVLHPEAYTQRKLVLPNGLEVNIPPPSRFDLRQSGVELIEEVGPSLLVDGKILVSGEIARTTNFERGFPIHYAQREAGWEPDPFIQDDQCVIMNVRDKGLIVLTGCGHAGIVNTVRNAQALTGVQDVYAILGGFHLTGGLFEPIIPETIAALQEINPRYVIPGHCTGWSAMHQIATAMPEAFIANSVGTTFTF